MTWSMVQPAASQMLQTMKVRLAGGGAFALLALVDLEVVAARQRELEHSLATVEARAAEVKKRLAVIGYKHLILDPKKKTVFLDRKGMSITLGGIAKGYAVDVWKGTGPWGVFTGLMLGIVVGFYELIKTMWRR